MVALALLAIMVNQHSTSDANRRLDPQKQREIIELAARLQELQRDHVSETELEDLAVEAGLEREYVREAMRKLTPKARTEAAPKTLPKISQPNGIWPEVSMAMACLAWAIACGSDHGYYTSPFWFCFAAVWAFLAGSLSRSRGFALGVGFAFAIATTFCSSRIYGPGYIAALSVYGLIATGGWILRQKLDQRRVIAPTSGPPVVLEDDRLERLEQLRTLRTQLESERTLRAFLSVDVVGSTQAKTQLDDLESERVFGLYQRWVASTVANFGGEVSTSAGDGAMAMFPNGLSAIRAAKALQLGIASFNIQSGAHLQIRCGISEGPVAWRPGMAVGSLHSPILDRAASRQKLAPPGGVAVGDEMVAEAAIEFGGVQAVNSATGERVFVSHVGA